MNPRCHFHDTTVFKTVAIRHSATFPKLAPNLRIERSPATFGVSLVPSTSGKKWVERRDSNPLNSWSQHEGSTLRLRSKPKYGSVGENRTLVVRVKAGCTKPLYDNTIKTKKMRPARTTLTPRIERGTGRLRDDYHTYGRLERPIPLNW